MSSEEHLSVPIATIPSWASSRSRVGSVLELASPTSPMMSTPSLWAQTVHGSLLVMMVMVMLRQLVILAVSQAFLVFRRLWWVQSVDWNMLNHPNALRNVAR